MRIQSTALLEESEKAVLDELSAIHRAALSTILRAGLLMFSAHTDEQAVWIAAADNNRENPKDSA